MRELFDFLGFFEHFKRKDMFVGLVHVVLQFGGKSQQSFGISLQFHLALLVGFFCHVFLHAVRESVGIVFRLRLPREWWGDGLL